MYIGMAVAKYWDEDWELYSKVEDIYKYLRDRIDFDHMDDYILDKVLLLDANAKEDAGACRRVRIAHAEQAPASRCGTRQSECLLRLYRCPPRALPHGRRHAAQNHGVSYDKGGIKKYR